MSRTFVRLATEERDPAGPPEPTELDVVGWQILDRTFGGELPAEIAAVLGWDVQRVERVIGSEPFRAARGRIEAGIARRIQRGSFGVAAIAKEAATGAMRRVVGLSRTAANEETKRKANLDVLAHAGIIPEKRILHVSPDRILDEMTADECERFARLGIVPERFREQMAPWVRGALPAPTDKAIVEAELIDDEEIDETANGG